MQDLSEQKGTMIQCVCLNPVFQRTLTIERVRINAVNRAKGNVLESVGGKGVNVARALMTLGQFPIVTGFCGGEIGKMVERLLRQDGLRFDFVPTETNTRTCTTIRDPVQATCTELIEEGLPVSSAEVTAMFQLYEKHLVDCALVTISGTAPGQVPSTIYYDFITKAKQQGIPALIDTQKALLRECVNAQPFLLKVNREELNVAFQQSFDSAVELDHIIHQLQQDGIEWIMLTQGQDPALVAHQGEFWEIQPPSVHPINPIGAGDVTLAGIASAMRQGRQMLQAIRFGIACGTAGVLTLTPGDIRLEDVDGLEGQISVKRRT